MSRRNRAPGSPSGTKRTLEFLPSELTAAPPLAAQTIPLELPWEEIGFLAYGLAMSSAPLRIATREITAEYSLGPRGAWFLTLIESGTVHPSDLTAIFRVGRSLITAELTRLIEAGLITNAKSESDGRRAELALTPLGRTVMLRVRGQLSRLITSRLSSYTRDEVLLCARMLRDFTVSDGAADQPLRIRLDQIINKKHPLVRLAATIDWRWIETELGPCPGKENAVEATARFVVGLLLLQSLFGLTEDEVRKRWVCDPYFQYFTGDGFFAHAFPAEHADVARWRRATSARLEPVLTEILRTIRTSDAFKALSDIADYAVS
jgi:DNA-binding MarR family transcriptional regulator